MNIICNFIWNISRSRKNSARHYHKCTQTFTVKYQLFLPDFNETWICADFRKILKISNFTKTSPMLAVNPCGRTERRTDRQKDIKLIVAFRTFVKAGSNWSCPCSSYGRIWEGSGMGSVIFSLCTRMGLWSASRTRRINPSGSTNLIKRRKSNHRWPGIVGAKINRARILRTSSPYLGSAGQPQTSTYLSSWA